jgi:NADH-quinone oxidoreductase subunit N
VSTDFLAALLPDAIVAGLLVALLVLEALRVDARIARVAFAAGSFAALAVALRQLQLGTTAVVLADEVTVDRTALLAKIVALACGAALAIGFGAVRGSRFWLLAASSLLGAIVIAGSAGFATFFLGIEILSLPAFALIVLDRGSSSAGEGALKYLVLSSIASALILFGVAITYGDSGSLAIGEWAQRFAAAEPRATVAAALIACGLFVKAAVFPFHGWAPDAYGSARLPVTAVLASLVKASIVLALVRLVGTLPLAANAGVLVIGLALASIVYGNLAALASRGLRRMLAYSSIAHAGYMLFVLADTTGARVDDLTWYALVYALGTLAACAAAARLFTDEDDALDALVGRAYERPAAAALLAIAVLSLAGLPPFPGFFAKLLVFRSAVASGHLVAALAAFAGSFVGLPYYVGIVVRLVRRANADERRPPVAVAPPDGRAPA